MTIRLIHLARLKSKEMRKKIERIALNSSIEGMSKKLPLTLEEYQAKYPTVTKTIKYEGLNIKVSIRDRVKKAKIRHLKGLRVLQEPNKSQFAYDLSDLELLIIKASNNLCYLCGKPLDETQTRDHVRPRSKGHGFARNKLFTHAACNHKKANRNPYVCEVLFLDITLEIRDKVLIKI